MVRISSNENPLAHKKPDAVVVVDEADIHFSDNAPSHESPIRQDQLAGQLLASDSTWCSLHPL